MKKRILALVLSLALLMSMVPGTLATSAASDSTSTQVEIGTPDPVVCDNCGAEGHTIETCEACTECKQTDAHAEGCSLNLLTGGDTEETPTETTTPSDVPTETTTPTETVSGNDLGDPQPCTTCGATDCTSTHETWCAECKKDDCGVDHSSQPEICEYCEVELTEDAVHADDCLSRCTCTPVDGVHQSECVFAPVVESAGPQVGDKIWINTNSVVYRNIGDTTGHTLLGNYEVKIKSIVDNEWYEFEFANLGIGETILQIGNYKYVRIENTSVEEPVVTDDNACNCGENAPENLADHADSCPRKHYIKTLFDGKTADEIYAQWETYDEATQNDLLNMLQVYDNAKYEALKKLVDGSVNSGTDDCELPDGTVVTVTGIPEGVGVEANIVTQAEYHDEVMFYTSGEDPVFSLDIDLKDENGDIWQPAEGNYVTVTVDVNMPDGSVVGVLHVHDGVASVIGFYGDHVVKDGKLSFETDGFSQFYGYTVTNTYTADPGDYYAERTPVDVGGLETNKFVTKVEDGFQISIEAYTEGEVIHATTGNKVDIILVLDMSAQMQKDDRLVEMKKAAISFIDSSITTDGSRRIALVPYNATASVKSGSMIDDDDALVPVTESSAVDLIAAVNALTGPTGASNIDQGMAKAAHIFQDGNTKVPEDRQRIVILLSAGVFGSGNLMNIEGKNGSQRTTIRYQNVADLNVAQNGLWIGNIIKTARGTTATPNFNDRYFNSYNDWNGTTLTNWTYDRVQSYFTSFFGTNYQGCGAEMYCIGVGMPKAELGGTTYGNFAANYKDSDAFWTNYGVLGTMINEVMYRMSSHRPDSSHVGNDQYNVWEQEWKKLGTYPSNIPGFWEGHYWDNYTRNVAMNFPDECSVSYFVATDDATDLSGIFNTINQNIGKVTMSLESTTVLKDVVTPQFAMPEIPAGQEASAVVKVYTMDYNGTTFDSSTKTDITDKVTVGMDAENRTITVTGYAYDDNYITSEGRGANNDFFGKKLIVEFVVTVKDEFLGGNYIPTNETNSGIYRSDGTTVVENFFVPHVDIPTTVTVEKTVVGGSADAEFGFNASGYSVFTSYQDIAAGTEGINEAENASNYLQADDDTVNENEFTLKSGGNKEIKDVLVGSTLTIEEYNATDYTTVVKVNGIEVSPTDGKYEITVTAGMEIEFINTYKYSNLTIQKSGYNETLDPNQSFMFRVKGAETHNSSVDLTVMVQGNGSVIVTEIPLGKYTVTEIEGWSWRYEQSGVSDADNTLSDGKVTVDLDGNTITFTNTRTENKWLSGDSYVENWFGTEGIKKRNGKNEIITN